MFKPNIYMCVCVCVCVCAGKTAKHMFEKLQKKNQQHGLSEGYDNIHVYFSSSVLDMSI